ncbi:MAG: flagellar FliJ family protein [Gemmatimonadetes bacterium]|nr:flagellar FliJ family protein [Gemmatimonadota bacterium]
MSRYRFPLETVRRLRAEQERASATELARAMTEASAADDAQRTLDELRRVGHEKLQEAGGDVARAQSVAVMLEQIGAHLDAASERSRTAWGAVQERYDAFVAALTDRKALDKLEERRREEWLLEHRRREQNALDDLSLQRRGRSEAGEAPDEDDPR